MLRELTAVVQRGESLLAEQVDAAVRSLTDETIAAESKAEFLVALARKGETAAEIAAFARLLRELAVQPPLDADLRSGEILDVVGTGGDHAGTFNISTTAALIAAAAGVTVAKHGNRAVTSQTGSADVLEALGVPIHLTPEQAAGALREHGFAFFFAPQYHPAFKHIAAARRLCADRGQRTIFNYLGPLLNPARPTAQLMGVPKPEWCEPLARVLQTLGVRRGMVACGHLRGNPSSAEAAVPPGALWLDELSIFGPTTVAEFYQERGMNVSELRAEHYPVQAATLADLRGGAREENAATVRRILHGTERGPKRDAALLNAGAALFIARRTRSIAEGWDLAAELIDSGGAAAKLQRVTQGT